MTINDRPKTIFVDGDACPVKKEVSDIGIEMGTSVFFVTTYDHQPKIEYDGDWVYVDPGNDSADLYILNHIQKKDILITEDIGLASLALAKGVYVLSAKGTEYKNHSMPMVLELRHLIAKERRRGNYGRGPKAITFEDRQQFQSSLRRILSKNEGI